MFSKKTYYIIPLACCFVFFNHCRNTPKNTRVQDPTARLVSDTARIKGFINKAYDHLATAPDSAEYYYRIAYEESDRLRYHDGIVVSALGITNRWFEEGLYDSCEFYYSIAERNADTPDFDKRLYVAVMLNKGTYYDLRGDKVNADKAFYKGLQIAGIPGRGGKTMKMYLLYNLANTKLDLGQPSEALYYIDEAGKVAATMKNKTFQPFIRFARARIYLEDGHIDSAEHIILKELPTMDTMEYDHLKVIATLYFKKKQPEKAIPYVKKGIRDAMHAGNLNEEEAMRMLLGRAYNQMQNFGEARKVLQQSLRTSEAKGLHRNIPDAYEALIETEKNLRNFEVAFFLKEKATSYNDSILNEKKRAELDELNVRYKTELKDLEISRKQLQLEEQEGKLFRQQFFAVSATLVAFFLTLVVIFIRRDAIRKNKIRQQELEMIRQENEIANLHSRMEGEEKERQRLSRELHDGIAAQISAAMLKLEVLKDQEPVLETSHTFRQIQSLLNTTAIDVRNTASNLMPHSLIHLGLMDALSEYIQTLKGAGTPHIDFQAFGAVNELPLQTTFFIYRIVQELLHNAIKHANAKHLLLQVTEIAGVVSITVEDDGIGFEFALTGKGTGLNNIRERVKKLGGTFSLRSDGITGTTAYIDFDAKTFVDE